MERRRTSPLRYGCWLRHSLIEWDRSQWPGQLVWEPDVTLRSSGVGEVVFLQLPRLGGGVGGRQLQRSGEA